MLTAVIAAREGSKRLKNKNILPFHDSNLLIHKIRTLKKLKRIDKIVVSTDSEKMIEMAISEGVEVQKRPKEFCDEKTKTFGEVVYYIADNLKTDDIIFSPCVCPLVKVETFDLALNGFYNKNKTFDSIVSATLLKEYIYNDKGPVNFSKENHVPSQKLPEWYIIVNGFFIAQKEDMKKWSFVYGKNPGLINLDKFEAIDIDDEFDYKLACCIDKMQMEKR